MSTRPPQVNFGPAAGAAGAGAIGAAATAAAPAEAASAQAEWRLPQAAAAQPRAAGAGGRLRKSAQWRDDSNREDACTKSHQGTPSELFFGPCPTCSTSGATVSATRSCCKILVTGGARFSPDEMVWKSCGNVLERPPAKNNEIKGEAARTTSLAGRPYQERRRRLPGSRPAIIRNIDSGSAFSRAQLAGKSARRATRECASTAPPARAARWRSAGSPCPRRQPPDERVDLRFRADVDAAGGLVENQHAAARRQPLREHQLLLVAAR